MTLQPMTRRPWTSEPSPLANPDAFCGAVLSPLRYPGAKRQLLPFIRALANADVYPVDLLVEPFCGGASISLALLGSGVARQGILADADPLVAAFWHAAAFDTERLLDVVDEPVTLERWDSWRKANPTDTLEQAKKCLFLNRTSFSGVLHGSAGPIGGRSQAGKYTVDCRFGRPGLKRRLSLVGDLGSATRILDVWGTSWPETLERLEAEFLCPTDRVLVYLDPPYVKQSDRLYGIDFGPEAHRELAAFLAGPLSYQWVLSYDDAPLIRELYGSDPQLVCYEVDHTYSATGARKAARRRTELLITNIDSVSLDLPLWGANRR